MSKIVFCGFGKLAKDCLVELFDMGYKVDYVLTHRELQEESVDTFAIRNNIMYSYKDARKNLRELLEAINVIKPKYLISVNYRYILPKEIFTIAGHALNIHGSLLPKYRGRTPHVWSIINGEMVTGVTSHLIDEAVDTGDIIEQRIINIREDDTGHSLLMKFNEIYPSLLMDSLNRLAAGSALRKQNEDEASYYGKRTPDMGYIDFYKESIDIINFVRAQSEPYPGAYYYLKDGRKIVINKLDIDQSIELNVSIGVIGKIGDSYYARCKDGILRIKEYRIIE